MAVLVTASAPIGSAIDQGVPSKDGIVVCTSAPACDAGAAILERGGNAVDAAVATAFALAVTHPSAGNIGGGGFMLVRAADGNVTSFDYREKAPGRSTRTMYVRDGKIDISLTNEGYLAPGVPGTVRGLALAHKRFGKLAWKDVVMPAVAMAEGGFVLSPALARSLNSQLFPTERNGAPSGGVMAKYPASVAAYGKPGGGQWAAGDQIVLGDLAKTLRAIASEGPDVFYKGWIADRIAEDMAVHGGLITKEDLAGYQAKERAPVTGTFRGYDIAAMAPPSSGGVAMIEMLNILEELRSEVERRGVGPGQASRDRSDAPCLSRSRAVPRRYRLRADTDRHLDVEGSREDVAATIDPAKASISAVLGKDILTTTMPGEPDETTHFSVIDRNGMAVSNTFTLEGGYGSRVVVNGAGFLLNNEMGDFNKNPGVTDERGTIGTPANLIDPGKRMLSSMSPTIISKNGRPVLITGSPGGRTIINTVFNVVLNVLEFGMNVREAVDAPRLDHEWMPDTVHIERAGADQALLDALTAMGHAGVTAGGAQGDANSIAVDASGTAWGAADTSRSADGKASPAAAHLTSAGPRK